MIKTAKKLIKENELEKVINNEIPKLEIFMNDQKKFLL
jgi:hypothetical protein